MADDLQRYLDGKPIEAKPASWAALLVKWARRRPAVASLLATLAIVLTASFAGMFSLWRHAEAERISAVDAKEAEARTSGRGNAARSCR